MCCCEHRSWLIDECLQTDPSKRITFNNIISHLLPSMSSEFHSVSHFCVSQCTAAHEPDAQRSPATTNTHSSVTGDNASPSGTFQQSRYGQLLAVNDEVIAVDSADSDVVDSERSICQKPYCATQIIVGSSWPEQQRPLAFCVAVDSCNINSGLAYHRLPAAC